MPWNEKTTIQEARETLARFLKETGCSDICAVCPAYPGGEGCCEGCQRLVKGKGCGSPNLSCLSYVCGVLWEHLHRQGKVEEFGRMVYGIPREGYRGCQRREDDELMQVSDPLEELAATISILSASTKEEVIGE